LFLAPGTTASHFDGWTGQHVHFGGEGGPDGTDQTLSQGNISVFHHEEEGRALRLFLQSGADRTVRYIGQYRLDPAVPFVRADAPFDPRRPAEVRSALVFRLLPLNGPPQGLPVAVAAAEERELRRTAPGAALGSVLLRTKPSAAQRSAGKLLRYEAYARWTCQAELTGYRIRLPHTLTELPVDLVDLTRNELIVVRPTTARTAVWTALGELHDLVRFFDPAPRRVLLLPAEPSRDLIDLLHGEQVTVVWPSGPEEFTRAEPPR
jgi:hypothetical protein